MQQSLSEPVYVNQQPNIQSSEIETSGVEVADGEDIQLQAELVDSSKIVQAMNQRPLSNGIISGFGFDRVKREVKFPGRKKNKKVLNFN